MLVQYFDFAKRLSVSAFVSCTYLKFVEVSLSVTSRFILMFFFYVFRDVIVQAT